MLVWLVLLVIACWYIGKNAPVLHRNQMINEQKQKRNRKMARVLLIVDVAVSLGLVIYQSQYVVMVALSIYLVVVFMMVADKKVVFRKKRGEIAI